MELWPPDRVSRSDYAVVGLAAIPLGRADKAHSLHPRGRGRPVDAGKNHRAGAKTPFFPPITPYLCQHSVLAAPRLNCWRLQSYPAVPRADCVRQQSGLATPRMPCWRLQSYSAVPRADCVLQKPGLAAPIGLHDRQCTCPAAPIGLHGHQCTCPAAPTMLHGCQCTYQATPRMLHGHQCAYPAAPRMLHGRHCTYPAAPRMLHCRPSSSLGVPTIYGGNPARVMHVGCVCPFPTHSVGGQPRNRFDRLKKLGGLSPHNSPALDRTSRAGLFLMAAR